MNKMSENKDNSGIFIVDRPPNVVVSVAALQAEIDRLRKSIKYMLDPYPEKIFPNWPKDRIKAVIDSMTDEQKLYLSNSNGVQSRHVVNCILRQYDKLTKEASNDKALKTLAEMYAEKHGLFYDSNQNCYTDQSGQVNDPLPDLTDLNILFEILEWWEGEDSIDFYREIIITRKGDEYHVLISQTGWGNDDYNKNGVEESSSLPTAIAEAMHKIKEATNE